MNQRIIDTLFLETAAQIAENIQGQEERDKVLAFTAVSYAEAGDIDGAVEVSEMIGDSYQRDRVLGLIAAASVPAGAAQNADAVLEMIEDDGAYGVGIEELAAAYAEAEEFEKAVEIAHRQSESSPVLSRIALAYVAHGREAEALEIVRTLDYPDLKILIYIEMAAKAVSEKLFPNAIELLDEATGAVEDIDYSAARLDAWISIANLYRACGQEDRAAEILSRASEVLAKAEDLDKDDYRAKLAIAFGDGRQFEDADRLMEEIDSPYHFAQATANVALSHHSAGDTGTARQLLTEAFEIVRDEEVYGAQTLAWRETLLDELARHHLMTGQFEKSLEIATSLATPDGRDTTLKELAVLCVGLGNNGQAFQVLELIREDPGKVLCEAKLIEAFSKSGQSDLADRILSQAASRVSSAEPPYRRAELALELVPCFVLCQQHEQAARTLFATLETLTAIADPYQIGRVLIAVAGYYRDLSLPVGEREKKVLGEISDKLD